MAEDLAPPAALRSGSPFRSWAAQAGAVIRSPLMAGKLEVDLDAYQARFDGEPIDLTPQHFELLALFLARPGWVWSRAQLHWICWEGAPAGRRVDVHLSRISAKLGVRIFRNVRNRGWALRPAEGA